MTLERVPAAALKIRPKHAKMKCTKRKTCTRPRFNVNVQVNATAVFYRGRHSDSGWMGTKYRACTLVLKVKLLCQFSETADALKRVFPFFSFCFPCGFLLRPDFWCRKRTATQLIFLKSKIKSTSVCIHTRSLTCRRIYTHTLIFDSRPQIVKRGV